jgi:single-strand DNA-binding protein
MNMNKLTIIGNLTKDPELRTTSGGKSVCSFSIAVNRKRKVDGQPEADFFRVSAWNALGENCQKYLAKGRKVAVVGAVSLHTYEANGKSGASMEVMAEDVEFLSPKSETVDKESGMQKVDPEDNPFKDEDTPY